MVPPTPGIFEVEAALASDKEELCIMEEYEWAYLKIRVSPEYMSCKERPTKVLMEDFSKLMDDEDTTDFNLCRR